MIEEILKVAGLTLFIWALSQYIGFLLKSLIDYLVDKGILK